MEGFESGVWSRPVVALGEYKAVALMVSYGMDIKLR